MTALFALSTVVQLNDPDPVRWMAMYGAATALSALAWSSRRVPPAASVAIAVIALTWGILAIRGGPGAPQYGHLFDAWEMRSPAVEEAREASGLLIVCAWMTVLFFRAVRPAKSGPPRQS